MTLMRPDGGARNSAPAGPAGLDLFMYALGYVESRNNYDAMGPKHPEYGRARGRFQMMEAFYPAWAREAGVNPNDWSAAAQERVARHRMSNLYRKYGTWDLVAVAWFAGEGRANKAAKQGITSVGGIRDSLGTSVSDYVGKVVSRMSAGSRPDAGSGPINEKQADASDAKKIAARPAPQPLAPVGNGVPLDDPVEPPMPAIGNTSRATQQQGGITQEVMGGILDTISETARQKGGQVLDLRSFLKMPNQDAAVMQGMTLNAPAPEVVQPEPEQPPVEAAEAAAPAADGPLAPPPKHDGFAKLTAGAQTQVQSLMGQFPGLRFTSGYRDPARNAAANGVKNSKHLSGQASDFVGTEAEMKAAERAAQAMGGKTIIEDRGSGRHLHVSWP